MSGIEPTKIKLRIGEFSHEQIKNHLEENELAVSNNEWWIKRGEVFTDILNGRNVVEDEISHLITSGYRDVNAGKIKIYDELDAYLRTIIEIVSNDLYISGLDSRNLYISQTNG